MTAATVVQVLQDLFYFLLHVLFYLWSLLYVADLLQYPRPTKSMHSSMHSSPTHLFYVPRHNLTFGSWVFPVSTIWNFLPLHIRQSQSLSTCKRHRKTRHTSSILKQPILTSIARTAVLARHCFYPYRPTDFRTCRFIYMLYMLSSRAKHLSNSGIAWKIWNSCSVFFSLSVLNYSPFFQILRTSAVRLQNADVGHSPVQTTDKRCLRLNSKIDKTQTCL